MLLLIKTSLPKVVQLFQNYSLCFETPPLVEHWAELGVTYPDFLSIGT